LIYVFSLGHVVPSPVGYIGKTKDVQEPFGLRKRNNRLVAAGSRHGNFDYEKHLIEQLALDRERLDFEKARFKKEVELRERELATIEKKIEHERTQFEKEREANLEKARLENAKVIRITDILREAVSGHSEAATTDAMDASVI
jgi:hypothetical protein